MSRKGQGRKKTTMEKITNESNRHVTFSKRRSGLFKKANELITLCGAEVGLIVISHSQKLYSYGHPHIETLIDRFLNNAPPHPHQWNNNNIIQLSEAAHPKPNVILTLNNTLTQLSRELEKENKKSEELKKKRRNSKTPEDWLKDSIKGFDINRANVSNAKLDDFKKRVSQKISQIETQNLFAGSSRLDRYGINGGYNMNSDNYASYIQNNGLPYGNISRIDGSYGLNHRLPDQYIQNPNLSFMREDTSQYQHHPYDFIPPYPRWDHY